MNAPLPRLLVLAATLCVGSVDRAAVADEPPAESKRTITYEIDAKLDAENHVVDATGRLTWRNDSTVEVSDMHLHLYLNAFRDKHSTFMRESDGTHRGHRFDEDHPGSIEVTRFVEAGGADLLPGASFIQPDDGNEKDRTVLDVPFSSPVAPGEERTFELAWKSTLPKVFARTGFGGEFHMVAQWYPKPGVFEEDPDGGDEPCWNCHQFHGSSEFFSDYGVYTVRITVPEAYAGRVGATGVLQNPEGRPNEDGTITYTFQAEDVHDFAWTCDTDTIVKEYDFDDDDDPRFVEARKYVSSLIGVPESQLDLPPVRVRVLLQPDHEDQAGRHRDAVFAALAHMGYRVGAYPYPTLTVVDPDHRARDAGGMEYPTLITGGTGYRVAEDGWTPQFVLIHEFGHQHFYGLLGTNEFESAWMDEGMNTWATAEVLKRAYPTSPSYEWYWGQPVAGDRPIPYDGWAAEAPAAIPALGKVLAEDIEIPFGKIGFIQSIAEAMGTEAPETISPWPGHGEASPLRFLREAPTLTLVRPLPIPVRELERSRAAEREQVDPILRTYAWHHMDRGSYANNSYRRTANALRSLEGLIGEDRMIGAMRTYAARYRFRHPRPQQFFEVVDEVAGGTVSWFPDAVFASTGHLDFGIGGVRVLEGEDEDDDVVEESQVTVRRFGEVPYPCEVVVTFEDGSIRRLRWDRDDSIRALDDGDVPDRLAPARDEQGRWVGLVFPGPHEVVAAEVDPHRLVSLDRDRTNDAWAKERRRVGLRLGIRVLAWTEMTTSFYGGL